jgi:alkylated DNA repair dioxygenase AlkB
MSYQQLNLLQLSPALPRSTPETFPIPNGDLVFYRDFFTPEDSDRYLENLDRTIQWQQDHITIYNQQIPLPRLTAWYGDAGKSYTYSGITMQPHAWTDVLLQIKERVEVVVGRQFNTVLLNYYRNGRDGVAWHSDDEPELGENPVIASVSFGGTRRFWLKHKHQKQLDKVAIDLTHGSLLLMQGTTQRFWLHQISKTMKAVQPRINLTFRSIE